MTRQKVKLTYITNASARKATYKKRKKGLIEKANDLSTLCDIDTCVIIYSPFEAQSEVYPSPLGTQQVLSKFKKMPQMEQSKNMVNQESFLTQRIAKVKEQLYKQKMDNREKEITQIMVQSLTGEKSLQDVDLPDLKDLDWLIEKYLNNINQRMEKIGISQEQERPQAAGNGSAGNGCSREATRHTEASKVVHGLDDQPARSGGTW